MDPYHSYQGFFWASNPDVQTLHVPGQDLAFTWTDSSDHTTTVTKLEDVLPKFSLVQTDYVKVVHFPGTYKLRESDVTLSYKKNFVSLMNTSKEIVIESNHSLEYFLDIFDTSHTIHAQTLTFRGVTFTTKLKGFSFPRSEYLLFENCTFEADAFNPGDWGKIDKWLTFQNTVIHRVQFQSGGSRNFTCKKVRLDGTNEYLTTNFQLGLHFPAMQSLTMKDVGELHVPDDAERIRNLQRLEITGAFQVHIPKPRFTAELTRLETFIFKPQTPSNEGDAFAYEIIRNMKREELKKVSVVCNTCRDFAMYRKRLGLDDKIFKLYLQGGEKFIWKARERKPSARRELKKLVGDEGYRTLITEDPRKAPIRYAMDTDINEATFNTKFDEHCHNPSHIQNYHESTSYPAIFRDVVRYMHGLSIEQKKSIFYYTSGKGSRMINELLLDRVEPHELQTFQIRHCNTLLKDVFSNIPPVREPFVVFRGYPSSTLDNGAFHSSTIRSDLFSGPDDWYTNFDRQSLAVKPLESENKSGCCHHIIRVMPGARVLYVEGTWAGISEYGEYEVLFAPCMGRFYHLRSFKDATNHIVCHDWVYVPEESPGASAGCGGTSESRKCRFRSRPENARILKSRFNKLKIALNVPHPAADSSCGMNGFIRVPSVPTIRATHKDPNQVATFVPGQKGLSYTSAKLTPSVMKTLMKLSKDAPVFHDGAAAGTIIFEPDGRLWIVHPTNKFVGYTSTFPKGTRDPGEDLRKTAIRETYEETGLLVSLKRYTGNCLDDTSGTREHNASNGAFAILKRDSGVTYYYLAKRESGSPADMGWESQAVSLVPVTSLGAQHVGRRYVSTSTWDVEPMEVIGEADKRSKDSMIVEFIESELLTIQEMLESDEW